MQIDLVALIVDEYDPAIAFFTDILGLDLVEDSPSFTNDGWPSGGWSFALPEHKRVSSLLVQTENAKLRPLATR